MCPNYLGKKIIIIKKKNCLVVLQVSKKDRVGRSVIFWGYTFGGFDAQKIKWSQTQVFLNGQMVYYTTKVLVRSISWKIIIFCLFWGKFNALKFWKKRKIILRGKKLNFLISAPKQNIWVGPAYYDRWSTTKQYFFSWPIWIAALLSFMQMQL